jgi:hypothetical protein
LANTNSFDKGRIVCDYFANPVSFMEFQALPDARIFFLKINQTHIGWLGSFSVLTPIDEPELLPLVCDFHKLLVIKGLPNFSVFASHGRRAIINYDSLCV